MFTYTAIKCILQRTTVLLVLIAILFAHPINHHGEMQRVEAGSFALELTQRQNTFYNSWSWQTEAANLFGKELGADGLAFAFAKTVISSITSSLINWVNSGFNGSPTFVQDLEGHLLDIADQTALDFIDEVFGDGTTAVLCEPFSLDVEFAVTMTTAEYLSDREGYEARECSISTIADNVDNFIAGDFAGAGGWDSWINMTQRPGENTAIGAQLTLESELLQLISKREGDEKRVLDFGQGFLSIRQCDYDVTPPNCSITTPGVVIAGQLNKALGVGQDVLVEADEINELISALLYQLVNRLFSRGLSTASNDIDGDPLLRSDADFSGTVLPPVGWDDIIDYVNPEFDDGGGDPTDPGEPPSVDDPVGPPNPPPADPVGGPSDPTDPGDPVDPPGDPADPADPVV